MKKLFLKTITTISLLAFNCVCSDATMLVVDYQGETVVHQQSIERNLLVNCNEAGRFNIAFKPLEDALRSLDGKVEIPLQNVYFNNTHEDIFMRYNDYSTVFENILMEGAPRQLTAKVRDFGMIPAGVYNLNFEVQTTDLETGTISSTSTFNLQFIVPVIQEIKVQGQTPQIRVSTENVIKGTKRMVNESSPMIYINSNSDWILNVKTDDFDNSKAKFYIRTIAASSNVNERLQEKVLLEPYREIILAKGKAPCNNQFVTVEFSVENENGKVIKAGNYENKIRYVLSEDRS